MAVSLGVMLAAGGAFAQARPASIDWSRDPLQQLERSKFGLALPEIPPVSGFMVPQAFPTPDSMSGMASLSCSGAVVRWGQAAQAKAVLLTNAHCYDMMRPNTYVAGKAYRRNIALFARGNRRVSAAATKVLYATLTDTDLALFELDKTYAELERAQVDFYEIDPAPARAGEGIVLASGFFRSVQRCGVESIVHRIRESSWEWKDSYKLDSCRAQHGMSGSPILSALTGRIVGVINTGNDNGGRCSFNNPCEVDEAGNVVVLRGKAYGQRVDHVMTCLDARGEFNAELPSCGLFHGQRVEGNDNPQGWM
ncbi:MAG: trypsin-like peptidase domain-containing protein [Proteobacteria bacterium]|nr:trypsin-like peptidase domain-containing protein [Pseudomonadota bacterium]